ncbi:MAG: DUF4252 domain-containing protein [Bacteroidales bacterium]|nr:DUF4252 domain-containing protein [Bacteroidales bacterium]
MKKIILFALFVLLTIQFSCITDQNKYKETDIFEEFEAENGFTILHLPPVLFKIALSAADDDSGVDTKELIDKIDVVKVMFFEEKENTLKNSDLSSTMKQKITDSEYVLLTRIAQEDNDISIYVVEKEKVVYEVLITVVSETEYISLNVVGNLTQEEIMEVYKAVDMNNIKNIGF